MKRGGRGTVGRGTPELRIDPTTTPPRAPLRVGVILADASVPRWVAHVIDRVESFSFADLVGFALDGEPRSRPRATWRRRPDRSHLLFDLYVRVDARWFGGSPDPLEEIDLSDRLQGLPLRGVDAPDSIERLRLDVVLDFGSGVVPDRIVDGARYGVWSYRIADGGGPARSAEICAQAPVAVSELVRLSRSQDEPQLLYRSFSAVDPISLHRSRSRVYWKSAEFALRKLRDLQRDGEQGIAQADGARPMAVRGDAPTNRDMLRFGRQVAVRVARQKAWKAVARQQWFVAFQPRGPELPSAGTLSGATVLMPPADRFYADPCLVERKGSSYLFFEEFRFAEGKGVVSCCRLTPDGRSTPPEIVLERPYHLSYPFVVFAGQDAFMLPETAANGAIELYKADSFPSGWALEAVLMTGVRAVDPTLIQHDGRYWLFANVAVNGASTNDELFLFSASSIHGPWQPHPRNPVISDVRRARPAGRPFVDTSGRLIRPSQDCSSAYGSAVVLNWIQALSPRDYRETPVGRLEPGWRRSNLGTHTYSRTERWEAVDGRAWVSTRRVSALAARRYRGRRRS
jgi:hypothetical protein